MIKAYICPECHNKTLYAVYENDNIYVCDECASEFIGEEQFNGAIKFSTSLDYDELNENISVYEEFTSDNETAQHLFRIIYDDYCSNIDKEAESLYDRFREGRESLADILVDMGYTETQENLFKKSIGARLEMVFDLSSLDNSYSIKYYVLHDGEIPSGYTYTKMKVVESITEDFTFNELEDSELYAVQYLDSSSGWTNHKIVDCPIEAQKERAELHKTTGCRTKVFKYSRGTNKKETDFVNAEQLTETLQKLSESVLTQNPIAKVVYGSIRVLLENSSDEKLRVVGYVSDVSFASKEVKSIDEGEEILDDIRELIVSLKDKITGEASYYNYLSNFDRVKKYIRNKLSVVKESINPNSVSAKSFNDLVKALADRGYEVDSADKHSPNSLYDTIVLYKDDQEYEATLNRYRDGSYQVILSEDLEDEELETAEQKISSANTSINSSKLPAIFNLVDFKSGSLNLDFGGGKFDNATELLAKQGVESLVYDPYNRTAEHNKEVLKKVRENGGADTITLSNVLNVIAESDSRQAVLRNCKKLLKSGGTLYITVYEGTGKGDSRETKAGYQLNKKTADYLDEISSVFSDVSRKGRLIIAK